MSYKFLKSGERKKLLVELEEDFGISNLPRILVETGKRKVRGFSGDMDINEIRELGEIANIEIIGLYLVKKERNLRLSLDGTHVLDVKKGIVSIGKEDLDLWMDGKDLQIKKDPGIYVIEFEGDKFGCAISNGDKLINHVPKERRVRRSHGRRGN